jgi:hypothetical protein
MQALDTLAVAAVVLCVAFAGLAAAAQAPAATQAATGDTMRAFDLSPALFVENKGQWNEAVRYGFDGRGVRVSFTDSGPVFQMLKTTGDKENPETAQVVFTATFAGARQVRPTALERSDTQVNYYIGDDPLKWQSGVASYKKILYKGLYDGIDLYTWGKRSGLKYEFHVAPGADWRQVVVRYEGIEGLAIDDKGALHVKTALGEMVDEAPVVYQETASGRKEIPSRFRLVGETGYGFEVTGAVDARVPLVLDPKLEWSSYLGGSDSETACGIACDSTGDAYVTGYTASENFPAPGGIDTGISGPNDAFVAKITPTGSLAWATYLGGDGAEIGYQVACDSTGNVWAVGNTSSTDFPVPGGFDTSLGGSAYPVVICDVFVVKFTPSGSLAWGSYLGGSGDDRGFAIACDSTGNAWVAGRTLSADFPVPGGFDTDSPNENDGFVARIAPEGSLAYGSFTGAPIHGIACDSTGNAWVVGYTALATFPTPGGFKTTNDHYFFDAVVARITPSGALAWGSYLGGTADDLGYAIACDSTGNAWVAGAAFSPDFPTPGGFVAPSNGVGGFVVRISPAGALSWGSILGGSDVISDRRMAITCDGLGNAWVAGYTSSPDFPVPGGFDTTLDPVAHVDAFVAKIAANGTLAFGSYLGGIGNDYGCGIACDPLGNVWVTGETWSADFPVLGGFSVGRSGSIDALIARISNLSVTTASLSAGTLGNAYAQTLAAAAGTPPYAWSVAGGSLPAGLGLVAATGAITGTPTATGTSSFTVQVADSWSPAGNATKALSITVTVSGPTYQYATSDGEASTTSTSYIGKVSLSFAPPVADDWIIFGFCEFKCPNVNYATFVQLFIDGAGEGQNTRKPVDPTDYLPFISVKVKNLTAAPHTIQIMYRAGNPAAAAYIRNARICAVRKAALEFYNVANDNAKPLTINSTDIAVLTWTPATIGNYLVISTAELNATTTVSTDLQTLYNGVVNDEGIMRAADNGDYTTFMSFNYCANAPAGIPITHKISGRKMATDPINHYIRRARILALRLSNGRFNNTAAGSATEQNTTQTTLQQCLSTTWTYGVNGYWLFLNSARVNNSSTSYQTEVRVQLNDGATCGQQLMRPKDVTDLLNYSSIDIRNLTTPRKVDMDWRTTNAAGTAKVKRLRFYGLPLDAQ